MSWRRTINIALPASAAVFLVAMSVVIIRAVAGGEPLARLDVPAAAARNPQFGAPVLVIPRGGVRQVTVTTSNRSTPLAIKMRLASEESATFSSRARGVLRASRPEVAYRGLEVTLPIGRPATRSITVDIYAKGVPDRPGAPIVVEEVRLAWDSVPSRFTQAIVWTMLVMGPLFLVLLIIRFAIGPIPDPSGD